MTINKRTKKLVIILSISAVIIIGTVFLVLGLTMREQKTMQQWLNDFKVAVNLDKTIEKQNVERNIEIKNGDVLVASYKQQYQVDLTGENPECYFLVEEKYYTVGTTDFNVFDEYYLSSGILGLKRILGSEEVSSSYSCDIDTFWQTVNVNMSQAQYNFDKKMFDNLQILHSDKEHSMTATIPSKNKEDFFGDGVNLKGMENIALSVSIDLDFKLKELAISYDVKGENETQTTTLKTNNNAYNGVSRPTWSD